MTQARHRCSTRLLISNLESQVLALEHSGLRPGVSSRRAEAAWIWMSLVNIRLPRLHPELTHRQAEINRPFQWKWKRLFLQGWRRVAAGVITRNCLFFSVLPSVITVLPPRLLRLFISATRCKRSCQLGFLFIFCYMTDRFNVWTGV